VRRWPVLLTAVALALSWGVPAPAGDPEVPERYISVDEVKALVDLRKHVVLVDVRVREQFEELHIRGARNLPLRELPRRVAEVPRQDFVVLY
jgi:3-mercaptopyruvate sulfurtransferase SseA